MEREEVRAYVNQYCHLRDVQYAAYELYARNVRVSSCRSLSRSIQ